MFVPLKTTERFDRTIFDGQGKKVIIKPKNIISLYYFYLTDKIVGQITGEVEALIYKQFQREKWIPTEIIHEGISYCGWLDESLFDLK